MLTQLKWVKIINKYKQIDIMIYIKNAETDSLERLLFEGWVGDNQSFV